MTNRTPLSGFGPKVQWENLTQNLFWGWGKGVFSFFLEGAGKGKYFTNKQGIHLIFRGGQNFPLTPMVHMCMPVCPLHSDQGKVF